MKIPRSWNIQSNPVGDKTGSQTAVEGGKWTDRSNGAQEWTQLPDSVDV